MWPPNDSSRNISDDDGDDIDECVNVMHRDSLDNFAFLYPNKEKECNHLSLVHTNNGASSSQSCDEDECSTWAKIFEEAEELLLHENASRSSSHTRSLATDKFQKGSKRKSKLRFSFHQSSCKEANSPRHRKCGNAMSSGVSEFHGGLEGLGQNSGPHSMAELLEGLGGQNDSLQPSDPSALTGRRSHLLRKGTSASSVYGLKQNGYVPELLDDGISSEEDGAQPGSQCEPTSFFAIAPIKEKTMADHFMEVFDVNAMNTDSEIPINKQKGFGYFGKLQQIMHGEKEKHTNFLKEVQKGAIDQVDTRFFDVEIVSRCLEAKLTVCCCLLAKKTKRSEHIQSLHDTVVDGKMESRTVVFNSTMCNTVDLEIGKLIRVYAPWEEVRLADGRIVFLSTYFSEILT
ncbi:uncharacterized protein LOC116264259 isoform X2 [Nymphaea colorata]|uniref:uncharacterized protein LOC116264259 isoform X2 n=1 Tax=Nymphaea colorata TaxID=210225 RepID=UPI00129D731C|nr:uncharacterized protein LOC116264259 isoform X2 [Nymphaea colorata]